MPDSKFGQLPVNLVEDTRYKNKSIYVSDFCSRRPQIPARRRAKTKETLRYAEDVVSILSSSPLKYYKFRNNKKATVGHNKFFHFVKLETKFTIFSNVSSKSISKYHGFSCNLTACENIGEI